MIATLIAGAIPTAVATGIAQVTRVTSRRRAERPLTQREIDALQEEHIEEFHALNTGQLPNEQRGGTR